MPFSRTAGIHSASSPVKRTIRAYLDAWQTGVLDCRTVHILKVLRYADPGILFTVLALDHEGDVGSRLERH